MKSLLPIALLILIFSFSSCIERPIPLNAPEPVESVDVLRYMGLWYELASYPQWFNATCGCTTAEYELINPQKVSVTNTCRTLNGQGVISKVNGSAVPVPASNGTKLTVSFFPNNQGSENGNYWIIELAEDYSYAVVSDPFRTSWYLLSRSPIMDEGLKNEIIDRAVESGFNRSKIKLTNQDCG